MRSVPLVMGPLLLLATAAGARLDVVASTTDLAYLAREIGGEHVTVTSIAPPTGDVHFVEVRPSYIVKVSRADVALKVGLELDLWMDRLIDRSRNGDLVIVDCSAGIQPLEVPSFRPDGRHGDLHRHGNPHYWLGPQNLAPLTLAIERGLSAAAPEHAARFADRRARFLAEIERALTALRTRATPLQGTEVVFYHKAWPYFCDYFGIRAAGFAEPYPGVPPSPTHTKDLIALVAERGVRVLAHSPYVDPAVPQRIARESDAVVVKLYPSIGGRQKDETYVDWLSANLDALLEANR